MRRFHLFLLAVALIGFPLAGLYYFWVDGNRKLEQAAEDAIADQIWPVLVSGDYNEFVATAIGELQEEVTGEQYAELTAGLDPDTELDAVDLHDVRIERRGAEAWHVANLSVDSEPADYRIEIIREATRPDVWRIGSIERTDR